MRVSDRVVDEHAGKDSQAALASPLGRPRMGLVNGPSLSRAASKYQGLAHRYDRSVAIADSVRAAAIDALDFTSRPVVIDVACGTGLSFAGLIERGAREVIAIEQSLEMLALARRRVTEAGWSNVCLIQSAVEAAPIPKVADAALFVLTHDVLRSPEAIANVCSHLRPGASVVTAGTKWLPWMLAPGNAYMYLKVRRYLTTFEGFQRPWQALEPWLEDLSVRTLLFGAGYVASGTVKSSVASDDRARTSDPAHQRLDAKASAIARSPVPRPGQPA